jgi:tripartite-type tricarboxylate transporter receptor subunit TctC
MRIKETVLCGILTVVFVLGVCPTWVDAQEAGFPAKPITIIVPFGPGGIIDLGARIFSDRLSKELKVPVIVENRAGGAGLIGATAFLTTKPDGYTLLAASGATMISAVQLSKTPPFDPRKDMLPVGYLADAPCAMTVAKNTPFNSFSEFLQYAKSNPGKLKGGISSLGGETHIMFESIVRDHKIDSKLVPYPAIGGLITAVMGGHLDWWCGTMPIAMPYHKSGDMRILLLTRKSPELPGVPSGADVGFPDISLNVWMGMFAHPKTPKPVHDMLVSAVSKVTKDPEVSKKLSETGFSVAYKNPSEFLKLIDEQWNIYAKVIREANIKVD